MMTTSTYKFSASVVTCYTGGRFGELKKIVSPATTILITDENVFKRHARKLRGWKTIVLRSGEEYKVQATADEIIGKLIEMEADRATTVVGVGGGVITDLAGYAASIFMRGINFGFVPTTVLAMVDASIGGKNGVDVGVFKNMAGVIRQPSFIFHDADFLNTLPDEQWDNGFAEIIKHGCIRDLAMIRMLEKFPLDYFRGNNTAMAELIKRNMGLKMKIVQRDEFEKGERRILNFGHTLGHALENQYELSHGHAVSIGMSFACKLSEHITGFKETDRIVNLIEKYYLPAFATFDPRKVYDILVHDKKRIRKDLHFVLLEKTGKAVIKPVSLKKVQRLLSEF